MGRDQLALHYKPRMLRAPQYAADIQQGKILTVFPAVVS